MYILYSIKEQQKVVTCLKRAYILSLVSFPGSSFNELNRDFADSNSASDANCGLNVWKDCGSTVAVLELQKKKKTRCS